MFLVFFSKAPRVWAKKGVEFTRNGPGGAHSFSLVLLLNKHP